MEIAGGTIGTVGLALQFFHVGKITFRLLSTMRDMVGDAKRIKTLVRVERMRYPLP